MSMSQQLVSNQQLTELEIKSLECGVDKNIYMSLTESIYPNAKHHSICMVIAYCKAKKIDPMLKPVHIVPMSVKTDRKDDRGKYIYESRDIIMPGVGSYRIDASRSGQYAGMSEPEFGEDITETLGDTKVTYPKWCKITVYKLLGERIVEFTAKEIWKENYATKDRFSSAPNAMWSKRAYGQLAKCTEAQALRKAFPDVVGQEVTGEEMMGKTFDHEYEPRRNLDVVKSLPVNQIVKQEEVEYDHDAFMLALAEIAICLDEDMLRQAFTKAYKNPKIYCNQKAKDDLVKAKDKKKLALENQQFINELAPDVMLLQSTEETACLK